MEVNYRKVDFFYIPLSLPDKMLSVLSRNILKSFLRSSQMKSWTTENKLSQEVKFCFISNYPKTTESSTRNKNKLFKAYLYFVYQN